MVFARFGVLPGWQYWKFVYKSLDDQLAAAQADHDGKVQTNKKLADDIPRYQELRTRVAKLRELIEKNQTALPSEAELAAFIETLQHKVTQSGVETQDRKSTRLNSSHLGISYAVFCLKKKKT